jgi:copper chaperone
METMNLKVRGMTCGGCAASVTRVLQAVEGVDRATVVLDAGSAEVVFEPSRTSASALKLAAKLALDDAGYELVD